MKASNKRKISWPEKIDFFENLLLVVIATIAMAILAIVATNLV